MGSCSDLLLLLPLRQSPGEQKVCLLLLQLLLAAAGRRGRAAGDTSAASLPAVRASAGAPAGSLPSPPFEVSPAAFRPSRPPLPRAAAECTASSSVASPLSPDRSRPRRLPSLPLPPRSGHGRLRRPKEWPPLRSRSPDDYWGSFCCSVRVSCC